MGHRISSNLIERTKGKMVSTKVRYSDEFKQRAVQLSEDSGKKMSEVAAELKIAPATLSKWRREAGVAVPRSGPEADELRKLRAELEKLRRQTKQLEKDKKMAEMERDILKKATAFFARDCK